MNNSSVVSEIMGFIEIDFLLGCWQIEFETSWRIILLMFHEIKYVLQYCIKCIYVFFYLNIKVIWNRIYIARLLWMRKNISSLGSILGMDTFRETGNVDNKCRYIYLVDRF